MSKNTSEIRSLTGLRGLAAIYVIIFHSSIIPETNNSPLSTFVNHGYLAVDLFFILSGFVMGMVHGTDFENEFTWSAYKQFLAKRLARIYPLYFVVLIATLALYYFYPARVPSDVPDISLKDISQNLVLIQSWGLSTSYIGAAWSISTELAAYVLFPLLVSVTILRSKNVSFFLGAIVVIILALLPSFISSGSTYISDLNIWKGDSFGPITRCICEFVIGLICFRFSRSVALRNFMDQNWLGIFVAFIIIGFMCFQNTDFAVVLLFAVLILSLASDKNHMAKLLSAPPLHWLGLISYSIYLTHRLVFWFREDIQLAMQNLGLPHAYTFSLLIRFPLIIVLGALTYYFIEKPMRNVIRSLSARDKIKTV